ncbi:hypothetical protein [Cryobacterium zhongshanensis]|uniref:Uncharacterized protein n=1 Tax=Cryobacterium zhongshanensis TaxID=2928153 RepID=A0AA41QXM6_9MICO|nr:hypothetical protein [Cryobacterium zhongshanensis]MCI4659322.1 hypothetical protein [Cryobacterium zhongshanensis]
MTVRGAKYGRGTALSAVVVIAGFFLLTGCSGQASPVRGTPAASATPTAVASAPTASEPPPAAAAVTDLYISATSLELRDDSGQTLATFGYFQPANEVVAGLSAAFGSPPITEDYASEHNEQHPGTRYVWGNAYVEDPGLGLNPYTKGDFVFTDEDPVGVAPYEPNTFVLVAADTVNGIHISTVDGIAVGDSAAELEARYPDTSFRYPHQPELDIGVGFVPLPPSNTYAGYESYAGSQLTFSVQLSAPDPLGPITVFRAPSANWGV